MHKLTTAIALLMGCSFASLLAQQEADSTLTSMAEAPDYQQILQQTYSSRSASFYPLLMQRYEQCDTTLTLEDYRNLYFGFSLQEDFIPYQKENTSALEARAQLTQSRAAIEDCPAALTKAQEALLDNPFDLPALTVIPICYYQLGDTINYRLWDMKLHGILDAIGSSGDGESAETAYHVINIEHEYEILARLGLELDQVEVVNMQTDFIRVKENNDSIPGVFFNFSACSKIFDQKYK